jgi:multicomponent Na+:H+ antiporter subunit D
MLGALLLPLLRGRLMQAWMLLLPVLGLVHVHLLPDDFSWTVTVFGDYELEIVRLDKLSRIFGYVFHIAAFLGAIYALHVKDKVQHVTSLMYAGATVGAVFAGDLITLFVYWELTAITSVFLIWARRTERAYRAGMRYVIIQVASGVLLLAGSILHFHDTGSIAFDHLGTDTLGTKLIFVAFGIKAAFPLLHGWLEDAYPEATVTGTVFLSSFTTKLAIYSLARGFAGTDILIPIGCAMTAFPIFYAVIENDLRRVLCYSLNNQLGYMVVGVGIGTEMALNGTASHAFAHILYKGLLFMSMGAVLYRTGTVKGSELGGLYKSMPWTAGFCMVGAAAISAFPLFSGFVSKSMILQAAADEHHTVAFLILLFASAGVFHHSGIKIPFFAFFAHDSGRRVKEAPGNMLVAMALGSAFCIGLGIWYGPLYDLLPYATDYNPYTSTHVVTQLQLLLFSALAFIFLQKTGLYPPELKSTNVDVDWTWRRALPATVAFVRRVGGGIWNGAVAGLLGLAGRAGRSIRRHHETPGMFGEPWPIGDTALWVTVLLTAYLVFLYL